MDRRILTFVKLALVLGIAMVLGELLSVRFVEWMRPADEIIVSGELSDLLPYIIVLAVSAAPLCLIAGVARIFRSQA